MTKAKHTRGPWRVYSAPLRQNFPVPIIEVQDRSGEPIVAWGGFDAANQSKAVKLANARLIAAAPELLDALRKCESFIAGQKPCAGANGYEEMHAARKAMAAVDSRHDNQGKK